MITADLLERALLRDMSRTAYSVLHRDSQNGIWTTIYPSNENAAQLHVWINGFGNCDILLGRAFILELELSESDLLLKLASAVIHGQLYEKIWSLGKSTLYSKSILKLDHNRMIVRSGIWLPYPWFWKHSYHYEPYV